MIKQSERDATIGRRIAMIRAHRLMSQAALAEAIGTTKSIIYHVEHGHTRVYLELAEQLATALHCTVADLRAPLEAPLPRIRLHGRLRRGVAKAAAPELSGERGDVDRLPAWHEVQASVRSEAC